MIVYIILKCWNGGEYETSEIYGVYLNKKDAEHDCKILNNKCKYSSLYHEVITEFVLDRPKE